MSEPVRVETLGDIALIAIVNPPVNAASHGVRQGLLEAIEALDGDPAIAAIALYGDGKTFIAGADIREFGMPAREPTLGAVANRIEGAQTPVLAVLHGNALGGGLEVALACHARIALPGLTVGFPEVTLGILPGAGGTQRAPRLIGIAAALDLATTGRRIGAEDALSLGLVDRLVDGEPRAIAENAAREAARSTLPTRRTGDISVAPDDAAIAETAERLEAQKAHLFAPHKVVEAIAASVGPLAEGLTRERALFNECLASPQRSGLIHAFFAERAVSKIPEGTAEARPVETVGVVGGGTMGSAIAAAALMRGLPVTLVERGEAEAAKARESVGTHLGGALARGKLTPAAHDEALSTKLTTSGSLDALAQTDLIIEAVFEDMDAKRALFEALDPITKPTAILATNTSYLAVDRIASATARPGAVVGLHFFSPAHVMRLVEVVVAARTEPSVVASAFGFAKRLGKIAVRAGVCDGFIGNRVWSQYRAACERMVLGGAAPAEVDAALEEFGFAMGPFKVADLAGLDIGAAMRRRRRAEGTLPDDAPAFLEKIVEGGDLGKKSGAGYYDYAGTAPVPNPAALAIIEEERRERGTRARAFATPEIVERALLAMICEGADVVDEGIALAPIDVDAVLLFGYGFPRHRGGPMHAADTMGLRTLTQRLRDLSREDAQTFRVPRLVEELADRDGAFADLNRARDSATAR